MMKHYIRFKVEPNISSFILEEGLETPNISFYGEIMAKISKLFSVTFIWVDHLSPDSFILEPDKSIHIVGNYDDATLAHQMLSSIIHTVEYTIRNCHPLEKQDKRVFSRKLRIALLNELKQHLDNLLVYAQNSAYNHLIEKKLEESRVIKIYRPGNPSFSKKREKTFGKSIKYKHRYIIWEH